MTRLAPMWLLTFLCACAPLAQQGSATGRNAVSAGRHGGAVDTTFVERDTTWRGVVRVDGVVHVRKAATLTLVPGTRVIFAGTTFDTADDHAGFSAPGIFVEGRIVAEGTQDAPVVFTSAAETPRPGAWDKILFEFSTGNRFAHCIFEGARYAVHAHFSELSFSRCLFRENEEGVRLGASRAAIEDSVFTRNAVRGINFRECRNVIRRNLVFENGDGVFLHSKDAASVIRENAIYANRGFNVRLGDLHADDMDLSGNWWGTPEEDEAGEKIHDARKQPGVGRARLSPLLARPPVAGAEVRGVFVRRLVPVPGGVVRAYLSPEKGFFGDDHVAEAVTGADGLFGLALPPGRYFIVGRAESPEGMYFAFPGKNPVTAGLGETVEIGLPAVVAPTRASSRVDGAARPSIVVRATVDGRPAAGIAVHAVRAKAPDFRGPGEAAGLTNREGVAVLHLPAGRYLLSARGYRSDGRRRGTGAAIGMVDEGGLFGVYPYSPVALPPASSVTVEIPLFEKRGLLSDEERGTPAAPSPTTEGTAAPEGPPAPADARPGTPGDAGIGGRISGEVRLSGAVHVREDLLVLPGAALVLLPGTVLHFARSESAKVDPEFFHGGAELVVRGSLSASGAEFRFPDRSGGIVVDGGTATLSGCRIQGAESGIAVVGGGKVTAAGPVLIRDCRVGVALFPGTAHGWEGSGEVALEGNGIGAVRFPGAGPLPETFKPRGSEEADRIAWEDGVDGRLADGPGPEGTTPLRAAPGRSALRVGDAFIDTDRTLSGDVVVEGVIRVAPGVRLTIAPGSRLFFGFRDTDGDGIGENGIFLQGNLVARGTTERPIGFYPYGDGGRGRWDAINFMASDAGENVLEHVEIDGAYRGLHAHFSRIRGKAIRISRCYRGVQFQESDVDLSGVDVASSHSVLRCRDSNVRIEGLGFRDSVSGANFLRSTVRLVRPSALSPGWYGVRFRESRAELSGGRISGGYTGVSVQEGTVRADRVEVRSSGLAGLAVLDGDVTIDHCVVRDSRVDALEATRGKVVVSAGSLTDYVRYAVKLGGPAEVVLRGTDAARGPAPRTGRESGEIPIYDGTVAPGLGVVRIE